ncbi:RRP15-like protein [Amborella trichopoda]|uniref:RRP15-like protein n=1 Tax=Amborella trichopoda TaxID=13333 RepID=W1PQR5_AMBTC|nr:RRP15-like protein [Amborella trichopoda]ERN10139.1 hypothetical protein AMTR_s00169p00054520 [Amborella trichopoda]|eukprot:XP_006848558.1 RRP15-like protein [Amborella trichopoda]
MDELQLQDTSNHSKKRKLEHNKKKKNKAKLSETPKKQKTSKKMQKLYQKRVAEYNSDNDEDVQSEGSSGHVSEEEEIGKFSDTDEEGKKETGSQKPDTSVGVIKFSEGSKAFRMAFMKIMKKKVTEDFLGPILSGDKKLIAKKLTAEEDENAQKASRKEKLLKLNQVKEKGHVRPANFLDTKEKLLISLATKGVVKLFNAVNKAQLVQKGVRVSKSKDAKELGKKSKEAFLAELRKESLPTRFNPMTSSVNKATKTEEGKNNDPGWALLRDNYMLTSSKLKDWDKMPGGAATAVSAETLVDSSSDEE